MLSQRELLVAETVAKINSGVTDLSVTCHNKAAQSPWYAYVYKNIGNEGAKAIAEALKTNTSVTRLNLRATLMHTHQSLLHNG